MLILGLASVTAGAAASPTEPLSLSALTVAPTNVSSSAPSTSSEVYDVQESKTASYQTTIAFHTQLITPATTTDAGLEYIYKDVTDSYYRTTATSKIQTLSVSTVADHSPYTGGKGVVLEADISSTIATTFIFYMSAYGNFTSSGGLYGAVIPALPTFYAATGSDPLSGAAYGGSSFILADQVYSSYSSDYHFSIAAGQTLHFKGAVYAGDQVSLAGFTLNFRSYNYDDKQTTDYYDDTVSTLYGANVLPRLAVPEPGTYAMLLAGFGVLALRRGRRTAAVTLS